MTSPKVTLALVCYAQEKFISEALASVFAQDYGPLEILISDDASPDATYEIVERMAADYRGPHKVRLNRNETNLGSVEHHQKIMTLASGEFVVFAHGDDVSFPHRTRRLVDTWREHNVPLVSSNAVIVDAEGTKIGVVQLVDADLHITAEQIAEQGWQPTMVGSTFSCHRDVFAKFAHIEPEDLFVGLDHVLPFRAGLLGGMRYLTEPLMRWRKHGTNLTTRIFDRSGSDLVLNETSDAFSAATRIHMLADLAIFLRERPDDPRLRALAAKLRTSTLHLVRRWTRRRNALMREGLRPTWIEKERLDAKPVAHDWNLRPSSSNKKPDDNGSPES